MPAYSLQREFAAAGIGVFAYDKRGTGESEGDPHLFGWDAQPDITGALDYLESRPDVDPDRIGLYGTSFGGSVGMSGTGGIITTTTITVTISPVRPVVFA